MPIFFVFFGRSGAGKGTQADLLGKYLKEQDQEHPTYYFQTGGFFRDFLKKDTYTSKLVKETLKKGGLLPEFLPIWIWGQYLIDNYTGKENLILDGISRKFLESAVLDTALDYYNIKKRYIILLNVSEKWASERLFERGRSDDTKNEIKRRLGWYKEKVVPAVDFFRDKKEYLFLDINGEQKIEEVHKEIISQVTL